MRRKETKITKLQRAVGGTIKTVDSLMQLLANAREDAALLDTQAEEELSEARVIYEATKISYKELQSRCNKVIAFANKILGQD